MNIDKTELQNNKPVMILGNVNTGKSNLAFYLADHSGFKDKYTLGYPKEIEGYKNITNLQAVIRIQNAVIVIDEVDNVIDMTSAYGKKVLKELLKFTAHQNVKLIMNTQLSQFISRVAEAFINCWAFTEIDVTTLKMQSKPRIILKNIITMPEIIRNNDMHLPIGRFIWYNEYTKTSGCYDFPNMEIKKDWVIG